MEKKYAHIAEVALVVLSYGSMKMICLPSYDEIHLREGKGKRFSRIWNRNASSRPTEPCGIEESRGRTSLEIHARENPPSPVVLRFSLFGVVSGRGGVGVYQVATAVGFSICDARRATHPWPTRAPTLPYNPDAQHVTRRGPGRAVVGDGERRRGVREAARRGTWHTYCLPFENLEPKDFSLRWEKGIW